MFEKLAKFMSSMVFCIFSNMFCSTDAAFGSCLTSMLSRLSMVRSICSVIDSNSVNFCWNWNTCSESLRV